MIFYGWNSYLLKRFAAWELGINSQEYSNAFFEYRQKYFHLFWIPFFPLGKIWVVKMNDQMYEPSQQMLQVLEQMNVKTWKWIWSWSLILAALLVYGFMNLSENIKQRKYESDRNGEKEFLADYFKDKEKHKKTVANYDYIVSLTDSLLNYRIANVSEYEDYSVPAVGNGGKEKLDTAEGALLKTMIMCLLSRNDSLVGYNEENTLMCSSYDEHINGISEVPKVSYIQSMRSGKFKDNNDDSSRMMKRIRNFNKKKYILISKEISRLMPKKMGDQFISGYSLNNCYLYDIDKHTKIKDFKILAANSEQVSSYGAAGSGVSYQALIGDLNRNITAEIVRYIFNFREEQPNPDRVVYKPGM